MSMVAMSLVQGLLAVLMIIICCLLMIVILIQKGRGGGLAGAFGGAGGSSSAFGAKTGDVFTWITVALATVFVLLAVVGNYAFDESALAVARRNQEAADDTSTAPEPGDAGEPTADDTAALAPEGAEEAVVPEPAETAAGSEAATETQTEPTPAPEKKEEPRSRQPRPPAPKPVPSPVKPRPSGGAG